MLYLLGRPLQHNPLPWNNIQRTHLQTSRGRMNPEPENNKDENPYLLMDFWEFAIMSTLMVVFFPWSLLFCVIFYGLTDTKYIVLALIHDAFKTILAILSILISLVIIIGVLVLIFNN